MLHPMSDLVVDNSLVGQRVCVPSRPEWGVGTVLRIQPTRVSGKPVHRVSIQFATGHRQMVVPPAKLAPPEDEPQREAGWLDEIGGRTLDDRLVTLPTEIAKFLGTPAQRVTVLAPLYTLTEEPESLLRWARRQANVADPLSLWSRDELLIAFRAFCNERDSELRKSAALVKQNDGPEALRALLDGFPVDAREQMLAALRRPL